MQTALEYDLGFLETLLKERRLLLKTPSFFFQEKKTLIPTQGQSIFWPLILEVLKVKTKLCSPVVEVQTFLWHWPFVVPGIVKPFMRT